MLAAVTGHLVTYIYIGLYRYIYNPNTYDQPAFLGAMQWIQDNITAFGGDPNKVTIFGQSVCTLFSNALYLLSNYSVYYYFVLRLYLQQFDFSAFCA